MAESKFSLVGVLDSNDRSEPHTTKKSYVSYGKIVRPILCGLDFVDRYHKKGNIFLAMKYHVARSQAVTFDPFVHQKDSMKS